jgi:transposase InsO family protein
VGIHPSTYYRWKRQLDRHGPEILRPRERRVPRMANATSPLVEQRVVAFALGTPGSAQPGSPPSSQVAADLAARGWKLERVMSDNASEFRSATFQATIATPGARHTVIRAGRPQTNGCLDLRSAVERGSGTRPGIKTQVRGLRLAPRVANA